jgi:hypothetical protein
MGDEKSTLGRETSALVSTTPALNQKAKAKPTIMAAIVKLMCLRIWNLQLGGMKICEQGV